MFADNSWYDYLNSAIILDELRSDDTEKRAAAIEKYLELIKTAIPNLNKQASIRDNYYALGGHHELVLQACGCCGRNDYKNILHGNIYDIGESFTSSVLRLDSTELKDYKHSRVEGYLNVTAMLYYANEKKVSFQQAYIDLYEKNTDAYFKSISENAFSKLTSESQQERPYVLYIVPDLVQFSSNTDASIKSIGSVCICIECNIQLGSNVRPDFSMCGKYECNYGYPKYLDNTNGITNLTIPERLALARSRTYATIVKLVKNDDIKALTGHTICFAHESIVNNQDSFPSKAFSDNLSIILVGSTSKDDYSSKDGKDLIRKGLSKGVLQLRAFLINAYAYGLKTFNKLYSNNNVIPITSDQIKQIINDIPVLVEQDDSTLKKELRTLADVANVRSEKKSEIFGANNRDAYILFYERIDVQQ